MMHPTLLTIATLVSVAAVPLTAHAYLTPDDVLYEGDFSARFFEPPPSKRELESIVEQQQKVSADRRAAEQAALNGAEEEPEEPTRPAAPEEEPAGDGEMSDLDALLDALERLQEIQNGGEATPSETVRDAEEERLLRRIQMREAASDEASYQAWLNSIGGETLRSGAPLTETGPATVLVTLAVAAAIGETWRRVRKADRE